jgi:hypothetical protein
VSISHGRSFRARTPYILRTYLWKRLNASVPACWSCSFTPAGQNASFFQDRIHHDTLERSTYERRRHPRSSRAAQRLWLFEFEISGAENGTERTYGIDFVGVMPAQFIERIKKLRHRALSSDISLSRRLKDVTHVDMYGFPAETGKHP